MKKVSLFLITGLIISALLGMNVYEFMSQSAQQTVTEAVEKNVFDIFSSVDPHTVENSIREAERLRFENHGGSTQKQIEETLEKLEKGETNLRKIFADTYFVGDSLMNGLEAYNILNSDRLITQVSATLYHLSGNLSAVIAANPSVLITHYGVNMLSSDSSTREDFIEFYSELLGKIQKALPETRIIVSGIFPVDPSVASDGSLSAIPAYNKALSEMCEKMEIEFLDSTELLKSNTDYYGGDGIHLSSGFYSDCWLPFIVENKGIIG